MLWCLRHDAAEVVGIDVLAQDDSAFAEASERLGVAAQGRFSFRKLDIESAPLLSRSFDLVLSNNVFEHVSGVSKALRALADVLEPKDGRIAIFSDPLWYSSVGSHLEHEPWEHLWGDSEALRERLLREGKAPAALHDLHLAEYFDREITLNRLRFVDYVEAFRQSGLVLHGLGVIPDRNLARFPEFEAKLSAQASAGITVQDLTTEGITAELGLSAK